jgi:hypothetical protein
MMVRGPFPRNFFLLYDNQRTDHANQWRSTQMINSIKQMYASVRMSRCFWDAMQDDTGVLQGLHRIRGA